MPAVRWCSRENSGKVRAVTGSAFSAGRGAKPRPGSARAPGIPPPASSRHVPTRSGGRRFPRAGRNPPAARDNAPRRRPRIPPWPGPGFGRRRRKRSAAGPPAGPHSESVPELPAKEGYRPVMGLWARAQAVSRAAASRAAVSGRSTVIPRRGPGGVLPPGAPRKRSWRSCPAIDPEIPCRNAPGTYRWCDIPWAGPGFPVGRLPR